MVILGGTKVKQRTSLVIPLPFEEWVLYSYKGKSSSVINSARNNVLVVSFFELGELYRYLNNGNMYGWEALLIAYIFNMNIYSAVLEWMYF